MSSYLTTVGMLFFLSSAGMSGSLFALDITGAGASFPAPLYVKWASDYEKLTQVMVNYQSIGSGGGIKQIEANTVDFGASDRPLSADELKQYGLLQFPTVIGGVVPVIHLEGVDSGKMKLTGEVLADIFSGTITQWNDEKIQTLNPDLPLPDCPITVVHRADGSGTTFLFTSYLSLVNQNWHQKAGANTTVAWPVGMGGKGNEGVSSYVQRIKGAIGYVEYAYAFRNNLTLIMLQNREGEFVAPSAASFTAAAASADWKESPDFGVLLINQPGKGSWPVSGATYILIYQQQVKPEQGKATLKFFDWAFKHGNQAAGALFYVPLPESVATMVEAEWTKKIKDTQGNPLWP